MKKDEYGYPSPETIGDYRDACTFIAGNETNSAVVLLDRLADRRGSEDKMGNLWDVLLPLLIPDPPMSEPVELTDTMEKGACVFITHSIDKARMDEFVRAVSEEAKATVEWAKVNKRIVLKVAGEQRDVRRVKKAVKKKRTLHDSWFKDAPQDLLYFLWWYNKHEWLA